jgi:hypothetical protein
VPPAGELLDRAAAADESAAPALRARFAAEGPLGFPFLTALFGDGLQERAEAALVQLAALGKPLRKMAVQLEVARLRRELGYEAAAVPERVLIDLLALAWLDLQVSEVDVTLTGRFGERGQAAAERRRGRAERRLVAAVRTLERHRGKAVPALAGLLDWAGAEGAGSARAGAG